MTSPIDLSGKPRSRHSLLQALHDMNGRDDPLGFFGLVDEIGEVIFSATPTAKELLGLRDALAELKASRFGVARCALIEALLPGEAPDNLCTKTLHEVEVMKRKKRTGFVGELVRLRLQHNV